MAIKLPIDLSILSQQALEQVAAQLPGRASRASNALRNSIMEVLSGERSGKTYRRPTGGTYVASAPGEPPAWRTGTLAKSWRPIIYGENHQNPAIESNVQYAWLDEGSPGGKIKPRPYEQKTIDAAMPEIEAIYSEPFDLDL